MSSQLSFFSCNATSSIVRDTDEAADPEFSGGDRDC